MQAPIIRWAGRGEDTDDSLSGVHFYEDLPAQWLGDEDFTANALIDITIIAR